MCKNHSSLDLDRQSGIDSKMSEVLFYHLELRPLEQVLPGLLETSLQRGWRVVVQASSPERVKSLSAALWNWGDGSFLAHGSAEDGFAGMQPIWLCCDDETPNQANIRFCIDGATASNIEKFERCIYMFDGHDEDAVNHARAQWKALKGSEHQLTYWQQNPQGRWEKKA